jgi:hypothetical protein
MPRIQILPAVVLGRSKHSADIDDHILRPLSVIAVGLLLPFFPERDNPRGMQTRFVGHSSLSAQKQNSDVGHNPKLLSDLLSQH